MPCCSVWSRRSGRTLALEVVLRKQHYVQACAQTAVLLYWGWYWPPVYAFAPFILAQLVFAYAFDMLLCWSRRDTYTLGFGPFPVIFSINLFLWFKPDWFYLQFAMVALGLAAKELIRWNKDGNGARTSSIPRRFRSRCFRWSCSSPARATSPGARTLRPRSSIRRTCTWCCFCSACLEQFFFGVASMTMSAVVATYLFGRALLRRDRHLFLLRFVHSDCRLPGDASAV